ncbi:MAG: AAA family ATPase [Bacteroidales bacterium]|nr:AAA family ATPase [Bacteroidales bacterium]
MTKEAIDQIYEQARRGDVFAKTLLGQILCEGRYVVQDRKNGLGWLRDASQCNCIYARELVNEYLSKPMEANVGSGANGNANSLPSMVDSSAELKSLIGLERVKEDVDSLRNLIKIQALRKQQGLPNTKVSYHCVFTGNPGTGKTTVARIVAGIYKELGLLKKGHLVEVDRSKLVAEYVGQTGPKTNKVIDEALDGVLFIDEAYSLLGGENDFGAEAIATLLKRMEDDRDRLVVILAGYTNEIKEFIESNPGLQSRFNRYIQFDDYSAEELTEIFKRSLRKSHYKIKRDAFEKLQTVIEKAVTSKDKHFGNARYVRNLFEKVVQNQANRLAKMDAINNEELSIITIEDIKI